MIKKIVDYIANPEYLLTWLDKKRIITLKDEIYLKILYKNMTKTELNLDNPQSFNEKLQWLKLNDRKDIYTTMVDKYEVKKYVADSIGEEYIIPTLGIYDRFEDIDFEKLPNKFVMKCTHDSGSTTVCKNKSTFDIKKAQKRLNKSLKHNYYYYGREWPYKNVKPRIIIERYMDEILIDYRFYCFNGKVKYVYMYISEDNGIEKPEPEKCNIYNEKWEQQEFRQMCEPTTEKYEKPENFEEMLELAEKLSKCTKFIRVDFYISKNQIYFGELTFFPGGGFSKFYPNSANMIIGDKLKLDDSRKETYQDT